MDNEKGVPVTEKTPCLAQAGLEKIFFTMESLILAQDER